MVERLPSPVLVGLFVCFFAACTSAPAARDEPRREKSRFPRTNASASAVPEAEAADPARPVVAYRVTPSPDLERLEVELCPSSIVPGRWRAGEDELNPYLLSAHQKGDPERIFLHDERGVDLSGLRAGDCAVLTIGLKSAARFERTVRAAEWTGDTIVTCPDLWLYRPVDFPRGLRGTLRIIDPDGLTHSAPFPQQPPGVYILGNSAYRWLSRVAFGPLHKAQVPVRDRTIEVVVLDPTRGPSLDVAKVFAAEIGRTLTLATGRFPRAFAQLTLEPTVWSKSVAFGRVVRGGAPGAHLIVSPSASAQDMAEDWVPTHELSHMFLPYIPRRHIWFSEGLATYYQNVLRARAGIITAEVAWHSLHAGFLRGEGGADDRSLNENAVRMGREFNFMRVYWGGTAFFLLVDVALRTRPHQPSSVDAVVDAIAACCLNTDRTYPAPDLAAAVDARIGGDLLTRLVDEVGRSKDAPDLTAAYAALGLVPDGDDLTFSATGRALRDAIMTAAERPPTPGDGPSPPR